MKRTSIDFTPNQKQPKRVKATLDVSGCVEYCARFLSSSQALKAYSSILDEVPFSQGKVRVFGKLFNEPRLTSAHGRVPGSYQYSGKTMEIKELTPTLLSLMDKVGEKVDRCFDFVLVNYYRDGQDYISYHSDDETSIDRTCIASLSLGATRTFRLRDSKDTHLQRDFELSSGDLVVMWADCQDRFQHTITKTSRTVSGRINLTFRILKQKKKVE